MDKSGPAYRESFLQWIWQHLHFELDGLHTCCGKPVTILDPGLLNPTDGPDFTGAALVIDGLRWYGDIEIHRRAKQWHHHGHHKDERYNSVILHAVFAKPGTEQGVRPDGTVLPILNLLPSLPANLQRLLERFDASDTIPCAGSFNHISRQVFEKQLEKARKEYFEVKLNSLLNWYNPDLPPVKAWKQMLITDLFDGLGLSLNREPMRRMASHILRQDVSGMTVEDLCTKALRLSRSKSFSRSWNYKSVRPNNHPRARIPQAVQLLHHILREPAETFLQHDPLLVWKTLTKRITAQPRLGEERSGILLGTVFLPSLYILGNLLFHKKLKESAYRNWNSLRIRLPSSILDPFDKTGFDTGSSRNKLAAVFQLKHYCRAHRCQRCEVFKRAINS